MNDKDWYTMLLRTMECKGTEEESAAECIHIMNLYGCPTEYKGKIARILDVYYYVDIVMQTLIKVNIENGMEQGIPFEKVLNETLEATRTTKADYDDVKEAMKYIVFPDDIQSVIRTALKS